MGHERIGILPRTQHWTDLVEKIGAFGGAQPDVSDIARQTIDNVRGRLRHIERDEGVKAAFQFLVALASSGRSISEPSRFLPSDLELPKKRSPLALAKALQDWVSKNQGSHEYGELAKASAADALAMWFAESRPAEKTLFTIEREDEAVWRKAATGAGFCEIARLFFGQFTERYLRYFLERQASTAASSLADRDLFEKNLHAHLDQISKHAFETARITQSFAAGWFNKHATQSVPSDSELEGFLSVAFGKLREELLRERQI